MILQLLLVLPIVTERLADLEICSGSTTNNSNKYTLELIDPIGVDTAVSSPV